MMPLIYGCIIGVFFLVASAVSFFEYSNMGAGCAFGLIGIVFIIIGYKVNKASD